MNNEAFLRFLTVDETFNLFQRQLEIFQKLNKQNPIYYLIILLSYYRTAFYNIPVELLYNMGLIEGMHPFLDRFHINIEVDCDCILFLK